jgi:hypothetical protein
MKNRNINDINDFKSRMKKLYEYKIHEFNMNNPKSVYHNMNEDENDPQGQTQQAPAQPEQSSPTPPPPAPAPEPMQQSQPAPAPSPAPVEDKKDNEMDMMSFLKSEMQKLDGVVSALENISASVENVSSRLDNLTKVVDEIREPSDIEKLEMRAFDSYPYNKTLDKVWAEKTKSKEEQDMERMGIQKTDNGYEMEYIPQRNFNYVQSSNNFNNY